MARADANIAQAKLDKGTQDLLSGVGQLYYGLVGAQRIQTTLELQIKLLQQLATAKATPDLRVVMDKVQLEVRKAYTAYEQAREAFRLAGEMVQARKEVERGAADPMAAASATAKAELERMKAEIAYRVAVAQLLGYLCPA